ncbi:MAG: hypothetical protein FWC34_05720 [Bacteroidetes bacterium]|nr:hypothetical protein [Bacteroidota bacterium]MCL2302470.1 hypothetical protein [Lentimicrobiaceae bacterium]
MAKKVTSSKTTTTHKTTQGSGTKKVSDSSSLSIGKNANVRGETTGTGPRSSRQKNNNDKN